MGLIVERWLPVVGYEEEYEVSDSGRVRSVDRLMERDPDEIKSGKRGEWRYRRIKGRLLGLYVTNRGYIMVSLGRHKRAEVHRLVLTAFVGDPPAEGGWQCRHLNGDKTDNRLCNLAWGTRGRNNQDRKYHNPNWCKLTPDDVRRIRRKYAKGEKVKLIAEQFAVTRSAVSKIVARHRSIHADVD